MKKIKNTSKAQRLIVHTGPRAPLVDPEMVRKALGAKRIYMSNDNDTKKYVSFTNYKTLALYLGLPKEAVMADKEAGMFDIMDLESVMAYVCSIKGWFFTTDTTAVREGQRGPRMPRRDSKGFPIVATDPLAGSTVRWQVTDNQKKDTDPYLRRTNVMRKGDKQ